MGTVTALGPRQHWKTLTHAPAAATAVDEIAVINSTRVCFAAADVAAGDNGEFVYEATDVEVTKAAVTIVEGDIAYYHSGNDNFTNVVTGAIECGVFREAAASGDATAKIDLHVI